MNIIEKSKEFYKKIGHKGGLVGGDRVKHLVEKGKKSERGEKHGKGSH
ncbi:MAG TPA: hypothetical protein VFF28_05190 [Candidatus Nanoarchaeia archaeon]|nr:hypothetical protein [Candidatus Nanoarchaeia archaeon]